MSARERSCVSAPRGAARAACRAARCSTRCSCIVGLIVMLACLAILAMLFIDLVRDGCAALQLGFLHELRVAQRRARRHSRGLGRHFADHAGDGDLCRAGRRRRGDLSRRVRAEELVHGDHRDQRDESGRRAVDRLRTAGARPVRLPVRSRPEHRRGRPDAGAADSADRDRRDARGDPLGAEGDPRSGLRAGRDALGSDQGPRAAVFHRRHPDRHDPRPVARDRRDRADHHDRRAELHRVPAGVAGQERVPVHLVPVAERIRSPRCRSRCSTGCRGRTRRSRRTPRPPARSCSA